MGEGANERKDSHEFTALGHGGEDNVLHFSSAHVANTQRSTWKSTHWVIDYFVLNHLLGARAAQSMCIYIRTFEDHKVFLGFHTHTAFFVVVFVVFTYRRGNVIQRKANALRVNHTDV